MKMSRNKYLLVALLAGLGLSACKKDFNAKSYAPPLNVNGYTSSAEIATSSLIAHWSFNGNLSDSVSKTTGVGTSTSFATGLLGQGLQDNSGYVVSAVPAAIQNLHSFTFSVWVNSPLNTGALGLVDIAHSQNFWGNLDIFFDNGGSATTGVLKVHVFNNSGSTSGSDAWEGGYTVSNPWNGWTNIAVTYNDSTSTVKVYYKGSLIGTNTATGFAPLNWTQATNMVFGTLQFETTPSLTSNVNNDPASPIYYGGWGEDLNGVMDEVRVYNRVLTSTEISSLAALQLREK
jgi:hypothetical protein